MNGRSLGLAQIFADITAGLTTSVISVSSAISLAAMVFSGDLNWTAL